MERAGFGTRLGSFIVDGLVMLGIMVVFIIAFIIGLRQGLQDCYRDFDDNIHCPPGAIKAAPIALGIAALVVGVIVGWWLMARWAGRGQTPGMRAVGVYLLDKQTGQPIGTPRAFGRMLFAQLISGQILWLGYLWMLWDRDRQTWHDKIVGAVVVRR